MARRYELTDQQWRLIEECFPPANATGRRRSDPYLMLNAIFYIQDRTLRVCSGASWRDLPERYGPWQTAYHWFNSWSKDTTFDRILEKLQVRLNEKGLVDLDTWYLDSTHVRASRAAAGAKKGGLKR